MTLVECVCSVSTVTTANGSGSRKTSRLTKPSAATTEERSRVGQCMQMNETKTDD